MRFLPSGPNFRADTIDGLYWLDRKEGDTFVPYAGGIKLSPVPLIRPQAEFLCREYYRIKMAEIGRSREEEIRKRPTIKGVHGTVIVDDPLDSAPDERDGREEVS